MLYVKPYHLKLVFPNGTLNGEGEENKSVFNQEKKHITFKIEKLHQCIDIEGLD